jgi:hypothetical protein
LLKSMGIFSNTAKIGMLGINISYKAILEIIICSVGTALFPFLVHSTIPFFHDSS